MKRLIVNADDFGLTRGVNRGIVEAHREGIVTSATIMANGEAFEDAAELARANPSLGVGVHIVLLGGRALAAREKLGGLVDKNGNLPASFRGIGITFLDAFTRSSHLEAEMRAQIERVLNAGITPTHLDTHKHLHGNLWILESLVRVAEEYRIFKIRMPFENLRGAFRFGGASGLQAAARRGFVLASRMAYPAFLHVARRKKMRMPDHFFGFVATGQMNRDGIVKIIQDLPGGTSELVTHPGICDDELKRQPTRLREQRTEELAALTDPFVIREIAARQVQLISYRELN
ncbi:MAG TPA: ChbG/HpnK family deacetylase [Candidatus Sulfotelmatobacter sp.]|nr:ChbG/HpnK family deacetylase [Candidatus Sulfotelmatobacter sp.]